MLDELNVAVGYRTAWGETLVFCHGKKQEALSCSGEGLWTGSIRRFDPRKGYAYAVVRDGRCVRREWKGHSLAGIPSGCRRAVIADRWNDMHGDQPFYSSFFTGTVFARPAPVPVPGELLGPGNVMFATEAANIRPGQVLAICGSAGILGSWKRPVPMYDGHYPVWKAAFPGILPGTEYKYVIADASTLEILEWEQGENRCFRYVPELLKGESGACGGALYVLDDRPPVFNTAPWRGAGTAVPVFSLRSSGSFGIGEFSDLRLLADWAAVTGQSIIQLLPVNDTTMTGTWADSYPYNANSTYALHPQFINLEMAGLKADDTYRRLREELNSLPTVDYDRVNKAKMTYLRELYAKKKKNVAESAEYFLFFKENSHWLVPYSVFCCLRDEYGTADFTAWKGWKKPSPAKIRAFAEAHPDEVGFWYFVQYHLHLQLLDAGRYARSKGVALKGDLPIGVGSTSVDAWLYPSLFNLDSCAGAPPDDFSAEGQNWGFPTYNWERMAEDGFSWWKARLGKMSEYFDAFRIDHILGFFRIWEIPAGFPGGLLGHFSPALPYSASELRSAGFDMEGAGYVLRAGEPASLDCLFIEDRKRPGYYHPRIAARDTESYSALPDSLKETFDRLYEEFFYHRHNGFWKESALTRLPALLSSTDMLACGEDLGMIPASVPEVMEGLKILSLEIERMPKAFGAHFADPSGYPYLCVCSTSTHDMTPLRAWWQENPEVTGRYWREVLGKTGEPPADCSPEICREIVRRHLESPAMLAILPLQDWLSVDARLRYGGNPGDERINDPSESRHYWRYRMHITLEDLLDSSEYNSMVRDMVFLGGRGK